MRLVGKKRPRYFGVGCPALTSDLNIYRAASLLLSRHGVDALVEAARLLDLSLDRGDLEARLVWFWVRKALK
jgi:hypothetical protein